jgi:hypothetical protein
MIAALKLLKDAQAKGWTFEVDQGEDDLIKTPSAAFAWTLVKDVGEANVYFYEGQHKVGCAYLMAPGPMSCDPEESLVDYSCSLAGDPKKAFELLCDAVIEEAA